MLLALHKLVSMLNVEAFVVVADAVSVLVAGVVVVVVVV